MKKKKRFSKNLVHRMPIQLIKFSFRYILSAFEIKFWPHRYKNHFESKIRPSKELFQKWNLVINETVTFSVILEEAFSSSFGSNRMLSTVSTHNKHIKSKHIPKISTRFLATRKCAYYEWAQYEFSASKSYQFFCRNYIWNVQIYKYDHFKVQNT